MKIVKFILVLAFLGLLMQTYDKCTGNDVVKAEKARILKVETDSVATELKKQAEIKQKNTPFIEKYKNTLSGWDGSDKTIVKIIKEQLNDPESFVHVKTMVIPAKNQGVSCFMEYRARNRFNALISQAVKWKIDTTWSITFIE